MEQQLVGVAGRLVSEKAASKQDLSLELVEHDLSAYYCFQVLLEMWAKLCSNRCRTTAQHELPPVTVAQHLCLLPLHHPLLPRMEMQYDLWVGVHRSWALLMTTSSYVETSHCPSRSRQLVG